MNEELLVSIIIPTYNRPHVLKKCLRHIKSLNYKKHEVIIADASANRLSEDIIKSFSGNVHYYKIPHQKKGAITQRVEVFPMIKGEIVAFLDDDSLVYPDWLDEILSAYNSTDKVGGVGGRALRGKHIYWDGKTPIGRIKNDGFLTEGFDGDPGKIIEVDHLIACNMSYRKDVLEKIGGWDKWYDIERAETDLAMRVKKAGYKILYNPKAVIDHIGALREGVKRFSLIYQYRMNRNHMYMLVKNYGFFDMKTLRYLIKSIFIEIYKCLGRITKALITLILNITAKVVGLFSALRSK